MKRSEHMSLVLFIIVGVLAGWLVSIVARGGAADAAADFLVGITGALIGGYILGWMKIDSSYGFFGALVMATIGALLSLSFVHIAKKIWA